MEESLSQIFFKCPSFCFMKSRKNCFKNTLKVAGFFVFIKIRTRAYIKNLRHSSLQRDVFGISEKFQYQVYNIKQEILGQKIKVKKND